MGVCGIDCRGLADLAFRLANGRTGLAGRAGGRRPTPRVRRWSCIAALVAVIVIAGCTSAVRWETPGDGYQGEYHTVMRGDTLYSIAFRHQLDYRKLARWNDVGAGYLIHPGQRLQLFAPAGVSSGPRSTASAPSARPPATASRPPASTPSPGTSSGKPPSTPQSGPRTASPTVVVGDPVADGAWRWPARGPVVRAFSARYKGIDIAGEVGDPVTATADGTVVYAGSALKGYGLLVIVKHSETQLSAYGHNRRIVVEEGQRVRAGERLAEMGLGPERKPLVHFEIRINGKPVDPVGRLPKTTG